MGTLDWLFQNLAQTMNCENYNAMVLFEGGPASRTLASLSMFGGDKIYEIFRKNYHKILCIIIVKSDTTHKITFRNYNFWNSFVSAFKKNKSPIFLLLFSNIFLNTHLSHDLHNFIFLIGLKHRN